MRRKVCIRTGRAEREKRTSQNRRAITTAATAALGPLAAGAEQRTPVHQAVMTRPSRVTTRSRSRATAAAVHGLLVRSDDELEVILVELANPLDPDPAAKLSSTCKRFLTPQLKMIVTKLSEQHKMAVAFGRKLGLSLAELRDTKELPVQAWREDRVEVEDFATIHVLLKKGALRGLSALTFESLWYMPEDCPEFDECMWTLLDSNSPLTTSELSSIKCLGVVGVGLGQPGLRVLEQAISSGALSSLQELYLDRNNLHGGLTVFARSLCHLPKLQRLSMNGCGLSDPVVPKLAEALSGLSTRPFLEVGDNKLLGKSKDILMEKLGVSNVTFESQMASVNYR